MKTIAAKTKSHLKMIRVLGALWALPAVLMGLGAPLVASMDRGLASVPEMRNWGLKNEISNSHIHAMDAWKIEEGSRDIVVAVIDTGIDPTHPDLKNNLWHNPDGGGYGWDFTKDEENPNDEHGHGTHVAGI